LVFNEGYASTGDGARSAARTGAAGELITLEQQDRSLWDEAMIAEGRRLVETAQSYRRAIGECTNAVERAFLERRLAQVSGR
ncbi:MAG TPA: DUF6596 domain-containing protein, partial [Longimicrobiales bacterium]|nr:DUF6596 domain-containing protein [Longimicrobiales bacterium]